MQKQKQKQRTLPPNTQKKPQGLFNLPKVNQRFDCRFWNQTYFCWVPKLRSANFVVTSLMEVSMSSWIWKHQSSYFAQLVHSSRVGSVVGMGGVCRCEHQCGQLKLLGVGRRSVFRGLERKWTASYTWHMGLQDIDSVIGKIALGRCMEKEGEWVAWGVSVTFFLQFLFLPLQ